MATRDELPPDHTSPDRGEMALATGGVMGATPVLGPYAEALEGKPLLQIMLNIETETLRTLAGLRTIWSRSYRAYHSSHWEGSKYTKPEFKSRSRLFDTKTRSAIRKNMATAAQALFSTADVVSVRAEYEDDPRKEASAQVIHEVLNYRLDRTSPRGGIPWFRISMGAAFNSQVHGVCASKQTWEYRTIKRKKMVQVEKPVMDEVSGLPMLMPPTDPMMPETAQPVMEMVEEEQVQTIVLADRLSCELLPPEHIWVDARASWDNPAQDGSFLVGRFPMTVGSLKAKMREENSRTPTVWLEIDDAVLKQGTRDYDNSGLRQAREGREGVNATMDVSGGGAAPDDDFKVAWVHENFMRFDGEDYTWWSLGSKIFLSEVACTRDIYPAFAGTRPYTFGVAAIEPHVIYPRSPVEAWQPLQTEINDLKNLHLDSLRQSIEPLAKVKSGSILDAKQLRMRASAGATVIVRNMDELEFQKMPEPPMQSYQQLSRLAVEFDELAGSFSGSSVASNRSLNETVGGMKMLSGAANATTEFDLRVWSETWVEPTLRQFVQLIQYYESDEIVLAIAGQKAQLLERYGIDQVTDDMLESEVSVTVDVGIGATDPMQRLQKLQMALQTLGGLVPFADRDVSVNMEEIITEVFGAAGYKEGMRFVTLGEPGQKSKSPEQAAAEIEAAVAAADIEARTSIATETNQSRENIAKLQQLGQLVEALIREEGQKERSLEAETTARRRDGLGTAAKLVATGQQARTRMDTTRETNAAVKKKASNG